MSTTATPKSLWRKIEHLGAGRFRVHVERGALEHCDQLNLKSETQRHRFAQACNAKEPGCYAEILALLERESLLEGAKYEADHDDGCRFVFTSLDKFTVEPTDWLWEKYIPAGAVTILEGDPGVGKTMVLCDIAARVSRGFLPPDRNSAFDAPGHDPELTPELVWWFSGGDRIEQTLLPRLLAAGANPANIRIVEGTEDMKSGKCRPVNFPGDFHSLWKGRKQGPRLVVIDPLSAFCGGSLNAQTLHKAVVELARFAASTGAAVIVVRPLNRRLGASASERGRAGPTLSTEARSALLLAQHPDDPDKQVLAVVKSNLCARAQSLEFQILDRASPERQRGESPQLTPASNDSWTDSHRSRSGLAKCYAPAVVWLGPSPLQADELVRVGAKPSAHACRSPFETKKVEEWLREKLTSGPRLASDIATQAELDAVPPILLRRARISLNIIPTGRNGSTTWRLPTIPPPAAGEGRVGGPPQAKCGESQSAESPSPAAGEGLGVRVTPSLCPIGEQTDQAPFPSTVDSDSLAEFEEQEPTVATGNLDPEDLELTRDLLAGPLLTPELLPDQNH